ncbi:MAG: hypothetical protein AAB353_04105 [Candidatus Hydrogenedentota bacterium]
MKIEVILPDLGEDGVQTVKVSAWPADGWSDWDTISVPPFGTKKADSTLRPESPF